MGKWAVVTGASSGIGSAIAEELAKRGYHILLGGRNEKQLSAIASQLKENYKIEATYIIADLSQPDGITFMADEIKKRAGEVEILVNNAGAGMWGKFASLDWDKQQQMLTLNNTALLQLTYAVLPAMQLNKKGYILNVGSTASFQAVPGMALYSASKVFVMQFSRALAMELAGSGVSVTCVSPGATATAFVDRAGMAGSSLEKQAEKFNMSPKEVAVTAINAMLAGKTVVTPGFVNQLNYVASRILPKKILENGAARLYLKDL